LAWWIIGSIPLSIAGGKNIEAVNKWRGNAAIPTSETIFFSHELDDSSGYVGHDSSVDRLMHPSPQDTITIDAELLNETVVEVPEKANMTPAERLEKQPYFVLLLGVMGFSFIIYYFVTNGFALN